MMRIKDGELSETVIGIIRQNFYPDGVAQIYPLIYEFPVKEKKKQKVLYDQFTERFQWQKLNKKRTGFLWAMTGMALRR